MSLVFSYLISLSLWIIGLINFFLWSLILIIISFVNTGEFFEVLVKTMCKTVTFLAGVRVKTHGLENFDKDKQYIVMFNHVNMFDHFVLYSVLPLKVRGLEEASHFKWPLYGWLDKRMGNIPIDRKNPIKAKKSLEKAIEFIKERKDFSILILPEGTRSITGKLGKFKKGGFLLALETGLDILPIIQVGGYRIKNKNTWVIIPGEVDIYFEKPINIKKYSKDTIDILINNTMNVFLKYLK